jgi:hypothetical protein
MNDFSEKRNFYRMAVNGAVKFRIDGDSEVSTGTVVNLSSSGLLMAFEREIPIATKMVVVITPAQTITPPLAAEVDVLRNEPSQQSGFHIACRIEKILPENAVSSDFF